MPLNPSLAGDQSLGHPDGVDGGPEFRDPRTTLGVEEMVSEEEARRRREQLNRRPSYRMILKDLETVGDKPMKKELDDNGSAMSSGGGGEQCANNGGPQTSNSLQQLPDSSTDSQFVSNGVTNLIGNLPKSAAGTSLPPGLRVGVSAASVPNNPMAHLSPPTQSHLNLGQLNLIAPAPPQGRLIAEIPSQPQPQIPPPGNAHQPLLANNLDILGLKAADGGLSAAFSQNEWQNNLLTNYNRQQIQQPPQQPPAPHLIQNPSNSGLNNVGQPQQIGQGGPPHGLGTRQGSASLTSFTPNRSDNDETSRKRQVRLLKNREAAKECRRKKKEYVKCLENRVAVLENQNKALIEELKTLKELYCRKEKGDMQ